MRAAKIDTTHAAVREALRNCGALVFDTSSVGRGFPDLVVQWRGQVTLIEVKTPKGKLTKAQVLFGLTWPVTVLRSEADAYAFCGVRYLGPGSRRGEWETQA